MVYIWTIKSYWYTIANAIIWLATLLAISSSIYSELHNNYFPGAFILKWLPARVFQCFCAIFYVSPLIAAEGSILILTVFLWCPVPLAELCRVEWISIFYLLSFRGIQGGGRSFRKYSPNVHHIQIHKFTGTQVHLFGGS